MTTSSEAFRDLPRLPRDVDSPVFAEPWQAQAFALAVRLSAEGYFTWKEWGATLADELQAASDRGEPDDGSRYYEHWLTALERLVTAKQLTDPSALLHRKEEWAEAYRDTPHGKPVALRRQASVSARACRQHVVRADGRVVSLLPRRAHLSYCFNSCCCGRTDRGFPEVPVDTFKNEWLRRKLRRVVHLTKAGCLGPCALANVASLLIDGRSIWFHSVNTSWHVVQIFDYVELLIGADRFVPAPPELASHVFNFYDWGTYGGGCAATEPAIAPERGIDRA